MSNQYHNKPRLSKKLENRLGILREGLESGDLEKLISPKISIDEYKSKMGSDEEIVVISFTIQGKEPALDLVNFVEKSYDWVIDADVSSGEIFDGSYIAFIEADRDPAIAEQIIELLEDLKNLTEHDVSDWNIYYAKTKKSLTPDLESLKAGIPGTPSEYQKIDRNQKNEVDKLKTAAGINVDTTAPKNEFTEGIRILAGIR